MARMQVVLFGTPAQVFAAIKVFTCLQYKVCVSHHRCATVLHSVFLCLQAQELIPPSGLFHFHSLASSQQCSTSTGEHKLLNENHPTLDPSQFAGGCLTAIRAVM